MDERRKEKKRMTRFQKGAGNMFVGIVGINREMVCFLRREMKRMSVSECVRERERVGWIFSCWR